MRLESLRSRKTRARRIFDTLDPCYPRIKTALHFENPFQLLVATILSAQCTDRQVNSVTPALFRKYPTPWEYLQAPIQELETDIRSTGFFRNKAKALKGCSAALVERFDGRVPATMDALLTLPGVGRKTANCVLGAVFDVPGVVVDTHVKRLATRLGLSAHSQPDRIEADIQELLPRTHWRRFSDLLIFHGRAICKARKPLHAACAVMGICPSRHL